MDEELKLERQTLQVNPEMLEVFNFAKQLNKTIILMADNYLPSAFIDSVLEEKGISGYVKTFVSSEYREGKWSGRLYELALKELNLSLSQVFFIEEYQAEIQAEIRAKTFIHKNVFYTYLASNQDARELYDKNRKSLAVSM